MSIHRESAPVIRNVGVVTLAALYDATLLAEPNDLAVGISIEEIKGCSPDVVTGDGRWALDVTCYLIQSRGKSILIDTGVGCRALDGMPRGQLDFGLASIGVDPGSIDTVVLTHLHVDHVGWCTCEDDSGNVRPFFTNAKYAVHHREWTLATSQKELGKPWNRHLTTTVLPVEQVGQLELVEPGDEITDEVSLIELPGHTPGHLAIRISSRGEEATIIGDASLYPAQLAHPDWYSVWDGDPALASQVRTELFDSLAEHSNCLIVAGHWPYPGIGHVVRSSTGLKLRAG